MELRDLIFLGACAIVGGDVATNPPRHFEDVEDWRIRKAVDIAKRVWEATGKHEDI